MPEWLGRKSDHDELVIATNDGTAIARIPGAARAQLQYLVTRLDLHASGMPQSVAITSAVGGEGVTFVSRALAAVLSEDMGRRTCLLEANWWDDDTGPRDDQSAGLGELLRREDVVVDDVLVPTRFAQLTLLPAGALPASQRIASATTERLAVVLDALRDRFDHVVLDLPALSTSNAAMTLAAAADASLLVARQGMTHVDQVASAVSDLQHTKLLGVVLNDNRLSMPAGLQRWLLDA